MVPRLIQSGKHTDQRGTLSFFNELDISEVKRMYFIEHPDISVVRAWQGHKKEQKWFFVTQGSFKLVLLQPDNWENPSSDLAVREFVLSSIQPTVLHVPGGYLNGFRALEANSKMLVFSDATVEESKADDYRFDKDKWYDWGEEPRKK
jgi:dTDP-4-dehydrorhamnose 3,5-epimerase